MNYSKKLETKLLLCEEEATVESNKMIVVQNIIATRSSKDLPLLAPFPVLHEFSLQQEMQA